MILTDDRKRMLDLMVKSGIRTYCDLEFNSSEFIRLKPSYRKLVVDDLSRRLGDHLMGVISQELAREPS